MNPRVLELAEQADLYARSDNSSMLFDVWKKRYTEKLVELIVEQCVDIIQLESHNAIRYTTFIGDASVTQVTIKKHFGVE
jgi:hypothetical protein